MMKHQGGQQGFTITELLIATTVFSVVLLVSLAGFLKIGQLFYKGITISQTGNTNQKIVDDLKSVIHSSSTAPSLHPSSKSGVQYYCADGVRYTFRVGYLVDLSNEDTNNNFGMIKDTVSTGSCPDPFDLGGFHDPHEEMLGDHMRLSNLSLASLPSFPTIVQINSVVSYGDDSVLTNPKTSAAVCETGLSTGRFCSVSRLITVINVGK